MVVPYLACAVLATPLHAFVPSCPWQIRCDISSSTVQLHQLFGVIFLNDCRDDVTVIFLAHLASPYMFMTTLRRPMRALRLGYLNISFPTSATLTTATLCMASSTTSSFALATSIWHKWLLSVLSTLVGFFSNPSVRVAHAWTAGDVRKQDKNVIGLVVFGVTKKLPDSILIANST
uniref:Uncharacterized protein n=1 Tax=Oryza punctata TaxID=4537 RepID=A0A0E0LAL8_ORYPU